MWTLARRPVSPLALLTVVLAAAGTGALISPVAAAAAVPGIVVRTVQSPLDSYDKTATVTCPTGKKVIDAGGYIEGGGGKVTMDDVFPDQNLDFVNVTGLETDPYTGNWRVHAYATCADPLPGLEWIRAQTASNSTSRKTVTAACSPGNTVLGSGYAITGGSGEVFVDEAVPNGGVGVAATQVSLIAAAGDPYTGNWDLNGYVICGDPLPGQQVLTVSTSSNSSDKGTFASCGGQVATGGSSELIAGEGEVLLASDYSGATTTSTGRGEENDGYIYSWSVNVYAFCADA